VVPKVVEATIVAQYRNGLNLFETICNATKTIRVAEKNRRAGQITPVQRHGHGIAAGFAKRRGCDLDDPKAERDFRHFRGCFVPII
jgi:hypothetical protein